MDGASLQLELVEVSSYSGEPLIAAQTYTVGINYNARGELIKYTYPMDRSSIELTMRPATSTKSSSLALHSIHEPTMPVEGWPPAPTRTV